MVETSLQFECRDKSSTSGFMQQTSFSHLDTRQGYRIVSGAVDFCIDDVLDKFYGVIGDSMNLCTKSEE